MADPEAKAQLATRADADKVAERYESWAASLPAPAAGGRGAAVERAMGIEPTTFSLGS